jgi:hypothetical protein
MRPVLLLVLLGLSCLSAPAAAGESYDNCAGTITSLPVTITTQGVWCLKGDLSTALTSGDAIEIATNNVTIDCNGFKLGGLGGGTGTTAVGVRATSRLNTTIRNCNIRGFYYGAIFLYGGGHVVEGSRFDANRHVGLYSNGDGVTIRDNQLVDTGGSTASDSAYGIYVQGFSHVIDNTVFGVVSAAGGEAMGIYSSTPGSIVGNRVSGVIGGSGSDYAIRQTGNYGVIRDNYVYGDVGFTHYGIHCSNSSTNTMDNVIAETVTGITNCSTNGDIVEL